MLSFFKKTQKEENAYVQAIPLVTDMHSHILPGLDDGAVDIEQSLSLIESLMGMGYKKLIATPHIMGDFYKNTPDGIRKKLAEVRLAVAERKWNIEIDAAAEYYLDEWFVERLRNEEPLLTFGDKRHLLFETSFINPPAQLNEAIFAMQAQGYKPVLAHPERYMYFFENFERLRDLHANGILLQLNINSLMGYYSLPAQIIAEKLIDLKMVSFAGTDCHTSKHIKALHTARSKKYYDKLISCELQNNFL
jgi:protein-tyrosine phosphatase